MDRKRKAAFKQSDLTRAIKAACNGGLQVETVEIAPDGTIKLCTQADRFVTQVNEPIRL